MNISTTNINITTMIIINIKTYSIITIIINIMIDKDDKTLALEALLVLLLALATLLILSTQ